MNSIKDILLRDEGLSLRPYKCSQGYLTIGIGRNLETRGITRDEAFYLLSNDIDQATNDADSFPWFHLLAEARKAVVVAMIFNLGLDGFGNFRRMIDALGVGDYDLAAKEMEDSLWAKQVGQRATRLAKMMRDGTFV